MKWFFYRVGTGIEMRARAESEDGAVGDAFHRMRWGESPFYGVTFSEFRKARAGVLEVDDAGKGRIVESAS